MGIELNAFFCKLQRETIARHGFTDRIEVHEGEEDEVNGGGGGGEGGGRGEVGDEVRWESWRQREEDIWEKHDVVIFYHIPLFTTPDHRGRRAAPRGRAA